MKINTYFLLCFVFFANVLVFPVKKDICEVFQESPEWMKIIKLLVIRCLIDIGFSKIKIFTKKCAVNDVYEVTFISAFHELVYKQDFLLFKMSLNSWFYFQIVWNFKISFTQYFYGIIIMEFEIYKYVYLNS